MFILYIDWGYFHFEAMLKHVRACAYAQCLLITISHRNCANISTEIELIFQNGVHALMF